MTQEVQPLTWSKRTNIEEHQQFFSKINEIIDNLAPTVDEAEQAIAQATAAIASANDAIATANAASAAASAAASQAQTAASTVAGYDSRMGTAEGKITAIEGREADYLKKTGAAQTVTSQIMVPTTATGVRDTQITNGTRIQNDLDAYAPMIRTTGNQTKSGILYFRNSPILQAPNHLGYLILNQNIESWDTTPPEVTERQRVFQISDKTNSQYMFRLNVDITNTGTVRLHYERRQIVNGVNTYDSGYLI